MATVAIASGQEEYETIDTQGDETYTALHLYEDADGRRYLSSCDPTETTGRLVAEMAAGRRS